MRLERIVTSQVSETYPTFEADVRGGAERSRTMNVNSKYFRREGIRFRHLVCGRTEKKCHVWSQKDLWIKKRGGLTISRVPRNNSHWEGLSRDAMEQRKTLRRLLFKQEEELLFCNGGAAV